MSRLGRPCNAVSDEPYDKAQKALKEVRKNSDFGHRLQAIIKEFAPVISHDLRQTSWLAELKCKVIKLRLFGSVRGGRYAAKSIEGIFFCKFFDKATFADSSASFYDDKT